MPENARSSIIVREVVARDFDAWLPLWEGYNAFYGRHGDTALPAAVTQGTWDRFLDPSVPMHALVATDGDALLGLAHYLFHGSTTQLSGVCYLQDLFTAESARRSGVGEMLIEAVLERTRLAGSARLYWQTHESNATARSLYDKVAERSGFIVYRMNP